MRQDDETFSQNMAQGLPWMVMSKLALFIIYLIVSTVTVRYLGAAEYGVYVICKSIAESLILLCALGMPAAFTRYVPELVMTRNRAGLLRLVSKAFGLQCVAVLAASAIILSLRYALEAAFDVVFDSALVLVCLLTFFELLKNNVNTLLTAFYRVKTLCCFSLCNGLVWLALLVILMQLEGTVMAALSAQTLAFAVIYVFAIFMIYRYIRTLSWQSPACGVGRLRVARHSGAALLGDAIRLMMLKYTELFFLGMVLNTEAVAMYDLAYSIPLMAIVFIPAATQDLFASGFSEAYVRSPDRLPELIRAYYKGLIVIAVPLAIFGYFTLTPVFVDLYGEAFSAAGELASVFCLFHILPLISVPLSLAIQAKERMHNMLPTMLLQLLVNIFLDYVFIVRWDMGIWGAFGAVALTFVLTIPIRLYVVKRLIGGVYLPFWFLLKVCVVSSGLAYLICAALAPKTLLSAVLLGVLYVIVLVGIATGTKMFSLQDRNDLLTLISKVHYQRFMRIRSTISNVFGRKYSQHYSVHEE